MGGGEGGKEGGGGRERGRRKRGRGQGRERKERKALEKKCPRQKQSKNFPRHNRRSRSSNDRFHNRGRRKN